MPTYLFSAVMILTIVVGLAREVFGSLPHWVVHCPHGVPDCTYAQQATQNRNSLITFGLIFVMSRPSPTAARP